MFDDDEEDKPIFVSIGGQKVAVKEVWHRKYEVYLAVFQPGISPVLHYGVYRNKRDAGEAAKEKLKSVVVDALAELDNEEMVDRAVDMIGKDTLLRWAVGLAEPSADNARNLEEWLNSVRDHPETHWSFDGRSVYKIEPYIDERLDPDYEESMALLGLSDWDRLIKQIGFEPHVAYKLF